MKAYFPCILLIILLCSPMVLPIPSVLAIPNTEFHGPNVYHDEVWSLSWGSLYNEESKCVAEDPLSGDLIWGNTIVVSSSEIYGVLHRVSSNGTIIWTVQLTQYNTPIPKKIVVNSALNLILVAVSVTQPGEILNVLYLFEFRLSDGMYLSSTLISKQFESNVVMNWTSNGALCIAAQIVTSLDQKDTNLTIYNPQTRDITPSVSIGLDGNIRNIPFDIISNDSLGRIQLLIQSYNSNLDTYSIRIVTYIIQDNILVYQSNQLIKSNLAQNVPIGFSFWNSRYYIAYQESKYLNLYRLKTDFTVEITKKIEGLYNTWYNFRVFTNGIAYVVGSGLNNMNGTTFSASQGIILKLENIQSGFENYSFNFYGNTSYYDSLTELLITSTLDLYIIGQGQSYGTDTIGDYDSYLINYYDSPIETKNDTTTTPLNPTQTTWMWIGIIGFTGCFVLLNLINRKKQFKHGN